MRLLDYESKLRELVSKDHTDPEIYNNLQQLIYYYLLRKKSCRRYEDASDISYEIASDIFMRIYNGETFTYFLPYLDRVYLRYILNYYNVNSPEIFVRDITDDMVANVYLTNPTNQDYHIVCEKMYLEHINQVVDIVMKNSKYKEGFLPYLNVKLSLVLSLYRGYPCYFHLSPEQADYVKFLVINFYNHVKTDGIDFIDW